MTENSLTVWSSTTDLLAGNSEAQVKEAARKLMKLTPNGNRLNAEQATDLAVYALLTGLNPFNNECYYMDRVGPVPGIAGYRVKATNFLFATAPHSIAPRCWEEYRPATTDEADFDPDKGDVAWVCTLFDSVSKERWQQRLIEVGIAYHQMGASFQEAREAALKDVGPCPSWSAVGVVKADEHFSGNAWRNNQKVEGEYKPEMWDRNERAKKRAAKGCYRKGFPKVNIPDREEGEIVDGAYSEEKQKIVAELQAEIPPQRTEAQIMQELGFSQPEPPAPVISEPPAPDQHEEPTDQQDKPKPPARKGNDGPTAFWSRVKELGLNQDQAAAIATKYHGADWPSALQELEATYSA